MLEESELPQLRNQPPILRSIKSVWAESIRVARAQKKLIKVRPLRFIKDLLLEVSRYRILGLAWSSMRQEICGLVSSKDDLTNIRVSPKPTLDGFPSNIRHNESLPERLEVQALNERREELPNLVPERKHRFPPGMFRDLVPKPLFGTRPWTPQRLFSSTIRALSWVGALDHDLAVDS